MEINTHESEVFVSTCEDKSIPIAMYAAACAAGLALFGAGYYVGKVMGQKAVIATSHVNDDLV